MKMVDKPANQAIALLEASKNLDSYETWSRLCLECLLPKWLAQPKPKNHL